LALLGKSETLQGDFNGPSLLDDGSDHLYHYFDGASDYATLISTRPDLVAAIELINSIPFSFTVPVYGTFVDMVHTVGGVTAAAAQALDDHGIGFPIDFGSGVSLTAYGSFQCWDIVNKVNLSVDHHDGIINGHVTDTGWTDITTLDWYPALNCTATPNCSDGVLTGGGKYTFTGDAMSGTGFYIVDIDNTNFVDDTPEGGWKIYRVRSKESTGGGPSCGCDGNPGQIRGCETMYYFDRQQGSGTDEGRWQRCLPKGIYPTSFSINSNNTAEDGVKMIGIRREPPGAWVTKASWGGAGQHTRTARTGNEEGKSSSSICCGN